MWISPIGIILFLNAVSSLSLLSPSFPSAAAAAAAVLCSLPLFLCLSLHQVINWPNGSPCQVDALALQQAFAKAGLLPAVLGGEWPSEYTAAEPPEEYDIFHTLIILDELARSSADSASILTTGAPEREHLLCLP